MAVAVGVATVLVAGAALVASRALTSSAATGSVPSVAAAPAVPASSTTTATPRHLTFDDVVVPADRLGAPPLTIKDSGSHRSRDDIALRLLDPGTRFTRDLDSIHDAIHRSATRPDGSTIDLTVIEMEDPSTAAGLADLARTSEVLGKEVAVPTLPDAIGLEIAGQGNRIETVLLAQRSYVIVVTITMPKGFTPSSELPTAIETAVPLATLQAKVMACETGARGPRPPGC